MDFSSFGNSYQSNGRSKISAPYVAVIALLVIGFFTIWMSWFTVKVDVFGFSKEESFDFTELMEHDEGYTEYKDRVGDYNMESIISKSDYDAIINSYRTMKYAGIVGYIMLGAALVGVFINKKVMALCSLLATLAFAVSMIGGILYCSKTISFIDDLFKKYMGSTAGIDYSMHISIGIIVALATSAGATAIGYKLFKDDRTVDYY